MRVDAIVKQRHNLHKRKSINSRRRRRKICTSQLSPCQWPILILFLFIISLSISGTPLSFVLGVGPSKNKAFFIIKTYGKGFRSVRFGISAPRDWNPRRYRLHHPPAETVSFCHHMSPFPDVDSPVRFCLRLSELISVLKRIRGFPIYLNDQIYKINGKGHSSSQQLKLRKLRKLRVVLPMWANTVGTNAVHGSGSAMWAVSIHKVHDSCNLPMEKLRRIQLGWWWMLNEK